MDTKDLLRARRIELGLSQLDVAKYVGVSEATVSRWESGDIANMAAGRIKLLAEVLQISPMAILGEPTGDKNDGLTNLLPSSSDTINNAPTNLGMDDKGYGLLSAYTENKNYLDESDTEDIELFIRMKAERKKAKDAAGKDTK